jgi:uncharacterized protein (TIGR03663 family)
LASPPHKIRWAIFLALALLALAIRLPQLGQRPMHTDEAINAYILGQVLEGQSFHYDPRDRHGPALAAFTLPLLKLEGAHSFSDLTESGLRLSTVLAGTATVLLFGEAVEMFGFVTCFIAALIFALAPLPVYYNRYFIHESWFVFATLGAILAGWHAIRRHSVSAAALTGFYGALMLAAKETAPLHFCCFALAALVYWFIFSRKNASASLPPQKVILTGLLVFAGTLLLLFTWFGQNRGVFMDLLRAIPNFTARAGGEGHEKPVWYYARLLIGGWSGAALVLLTLLGAYRVLVARQGSEPVAPASLSVDEALSTQSALRFILVIYGLGIFIAYSLIPYKTPWLALNFFLPMALMAGMAVEFIWFSLITLCARAGLVVVLVVLGFLMAHDTWQRVFVSPADPNNPYAYAHTVDGLLDLPQRIAELTSKGDLVDPRIAVVAADPWPLPWYLRHFSQVGFWQPGEAPGPADFFITSPEAADKMNGWLKQYHPEYYGLRPEVLIILWVPDWVPKSP